MAPKHDRYSMEHAILKALDAAGGTGAALARDVPLGSSGCRADLAIWADEWIGFAIRPAGPADDLPRTLRTYARYVDRVALVVPDRSPLPRPAELHGAALWSVDEGGGLAEHAAGTPHRVGMAALLDWLPAGERARLLRPLVPTEAYDRERPPISEAEVRAQVEEWLIGEFARDAAVLSAA